MSFKKIDILKDLDLDKTGANPFFMDNYMKKSSLLNGPYFSQKYRTTDL